jgi:MYXO-CTERM domain-containing protein
MRQSNPAWDPYRSDCSGLVSWAWGLAAPGYTTAEFAPNATSNTSVIQASSLAMGDAVNTDDSASSEHHIMLFKAWVTPGQEATFIEEPGCSANPNYAHEFTSAVTLNGTSITVQYNGITFKAIRFAGLTASATYAAKYVTQSWPLSSAPPIPMTVGAAQKGSIDMTNTGTATWKAGVVKLAPIPRDQPSPFQAPSWLSPTRVSTLAQDVAPGAVGHFEWDLDPSQPGSFQPYFGLVAEGVTWFADSGGPPDDDIQVNVQVSPAPPGTGTGGAAGSGSGASSSSGSGQSTGTGQGTGAVASAGSGKEPGGSPNASSGCRMGPAEPPSAAGLGLLAALFLVRRRRRHCVQ